MNHTSTETAWLDHLAGQRSHTDDKLCSACLAFFTQPMEGRVNFRHIKFCSSLAKSAERGCPLCSALSKRLRRSRHQDVLPEELNLTFSWIRLAAGNELMVSHQIYKSTDRQEIAGYRPDIQFRLEPAKGQYNRFVMGPVAYSCLVILQALFLTNFRKICPQ